MNELNELDELDELDEFNELNKKTADQFSSYISRGKDDLDAVFKEMVILPLMKNIEIGMDVNRDKDKWDSFSVPGAKYTEDLSKILNEFYKDIQDANAMVLCTVDTKNCPSSRIVLARDITSKGIVFL